MKYFITKYALTTGIYEVEGEEIGKGILKVFNGVSPDYYHDNDYHETFEKAVRQANKMRNKSIDRWQKKIEGLKSLNFKESRR